MKTKKILFSGLASIALLGAGVYSIQHTVVNAEETKITQEEKDLLKKKVEEFKKGYEDYLKSNPDLTKEEKEKIEAKYKEIIGGVDSMLNNPSFDLDEFISRIDNYGNLHVKPASSTEKTKLTKEEKDKLKNKVEEFKKGYEKFLKENPDLTKEEKEKIEAKYNEIINDVDSMLNNPSFDLDEFISRIDEKGNLHYIPKYAPVREKLPTLNLFEENSSDYNTGITKPTSNEANTSSKTTAQETGKQEQVAPATEKAGKQEQVTPATQEAPKQEEAKKAELPQTGMADSLATIGAAVASLVAGLGLAFTGKEKQ